MTDPAAAPNVAAPNAAAPNAAPPPPATLPETATPPVRKPDTANATRKRRRPPRKAFDALILLVFVGLIGYGVYRYFDEIFAALYSRTAMVVMIVIVVEYLILKSFDRTRLYRLENQRLARRRKADVQAMRTAESALAGLIREPPMPPTEVLRRRQLVGSMIVDETDEEYDPTKTPFEDELGRYREIEGDPDPDAPTRTDTDEPRDAVPETPESTDVPETSESTDAPETDGTPSGAPLPNAAPPEAVRAARRALRILRKRIY